MKSKKQTPLGYLMALLEVSLADLGDYLYVAQTSISKWKTGARQLKPTSQHFEGIVEYFSMLSRDLQRREKLLQLFGKLYPQHPLETQQDIAERIRDFLTGSQLPTATLQQSLSDAGRLYTAEIAVYGGEKGFQSACGLFLGTLLEMEKGEQQIAIISRWNASTLDRLLPVLERGSAIRLLMEMPTPEELLTGLSAVLAHPGLSVRLLHENAPIFPRRIQCVAGGRMLLNGSWPAGQPPYAAIYTDPLSIEQQQRCFEIAWRDAVDVFSTAAAERLSADAYRHMEAITIEETLDWLLPSLPYLTMSRALLMEVLRANDVSGRVWTRVLGGCDALANQSMRLLVPSGALRSPPTTLPVLSALCGKTIRVTSAQAKRHLLDTAALLREGKTLQLTPMQNETPDAWKRVSMFVKRNAYGGWISFPHAVVRFSQRPQVVQCHMRAFEALLLSETDMLQRPEYVANLLERSALS